MADFAWAVAPNPDKTVTVRVRSAKFGDGYEQRVIDGINTQPQSWSVRLQGKLNTEATAIETFLQTKAGAVAFTWLPPGASAEIKVTCKTWRRTQVTPTVCDISATFEQVFGA